MEEMGDAQPAPRCAQIAALATAVDGLCDRSTLRSMSDAEVVAFLRDLEEQANRIAARSLRAIADIEERNLAAVKGVTSLSGFIGPVLRITPNEARCRVRAMRVLEETLSVSGGVVEPVLPQAAAALAEGGISTAHVEEIAKVMRKVPKTLPVDVHIDAERSMVGAARTLDPTQLANVGTRLIDTIDPDGRPPAEEDEEAHTRRRGFRLDQQADGSWIPRGRLTPDTGAELNAVIDHLAAPVTQDPSVGGDPGEALNPVDEALLGPVPEGWDPRTRYQRGHDALAELADAYLRGMVDGGPHGGRDCGAKAGDGCRSKSDDGSGAASGDDAGANQGDGSGAASGDDAGATKPRASKAPTLILFGSATDFRDNTGMATTGQGQQIPMWAARALVDQATVYGVTLDSIGCVLNEWRQKRLATPAQTAAVIARDRGCTIRGCSRPVSRTQVHHVTEWFHDGPSNVDNYALLCFFHHRYFSQLGYTCSMIEGVPHWTAPPYLDPDQVPRRHERFDLPPPA